MLVGLGGVWSPLRQLELCVGVCVCLRQKESSYQETRSDFITALCQEFQTTQDMESNAEGLGEGE